MTALELSRRLVAAGCSPMVEGRELVIDAEPPAALAPLLLVLHTGVRAALVGSQWWGLPESGRAVPLDPARPVPESVRFLAVGGDADGCWDRVTSSMRLDAPAAFAPDTVRPGGPAQGRKSPAESTPPRGRRAIAPGVNG